MLANKTFHLVLFLGRHDNEPVLGPNNQWFRTSSPNRLYLLYTYNGPEAVILIKIRKLRGSGYAKWKDNRLISKCLLKGKAEPNNQLEALRQYITQVTCCSVSEVSAAGWITHYKPEKTPSRRLL